MNAKTQQGFTLIELMIVVAIIGILAAIAIPAYNIYLVRAKVTEAVTTASACKASVSEYYQSQNAFPSNLGQAGCTTNPTRYVTSTDVVGNGVITIALSASAAPATGNYLLTPTDAGSGGLTWSCTGSTIQSRYLPSNCR